MHRKLKLVTKNKRNLGAKQGVGGKTNRTLIKRNSYSSGRGTWQKKTEMTNSYEL
jgi:hypothetical protein